MRPAGDIPPVPAWFRDEVMALFALYPNTNASAATAVAWWRHLHKMPREALLWAFQRAPASSMNFAPSAALVLDHAKAWRPPTPQPDLTRPALPEPEPELPQDHPLHAEFEEIKARAKSGQLRGSDVVRAFARFVAERL